MRQEKTLKIICNHFLDPRIALVPNSGTDKSYVWVAWDYSDMTELVETTFAIRFGNSELASKFKDEFIKFQGEMKELLGEGEHGPTKSEEESTVGKEEADATADAIATLSIKSEVKNEASPEKA